MENFFIFGIITCFISTISTFPLNCSEDRPLLYGVPVVEDIEISPNYPPPEYIMPLIIEGSTPEPDSGNPIGADCNQVKHMGYAQVSALKSKLMPLEEFMENHCLPDNVCFKVMKDASPILDLKTCDNSIQPLVLE